MTKKQLADKCGIQERQIRYIVVGLNLKEDSDFFYMQSGARNTRRIHFTESGVKKVMSRPIIRKKAKDTTM